VPLEKLHMAAGLSIRDTKKVDRFSLLGVAAARAAWSHCSLSDEESINCGIITGNMFAGWTFTEPQLRSLHKHGIDNVSPYLATAWFPAAPQGQITINLKMRGFAKTITTDRCSGSQAIGLAFERIRNSRSDLLLAGGVEAPVTPFVEAALVSDGLDSSSLSEAAAYLLLASSHQTSLTIEAHATFPLHSSSGFSSETLRRQIVAFLKKGLKLPRVKFVVCNTPPAGSCESQTRSLICEIFGQPLPQLLFPTTVTGECLAASGPVSGVLCSHILKREKTSCSALVLSIGHQCGDLMWMTWQP
jgi:hypothetical protein